MAFRHTSLKLFLFSDKEWVHLDKFSCWWKANSSETITPFLPAAVIWWRYKCHQLIWLTDWSPGPMCFLLPIPTLVALYSYLVTDLQLSRPEVIICKRLVFFPFSPLKFILNEFSDIIWHETMNIFKETSTGMSLRVQIIKMQQPKGVNFVDPRTQSIAECRLWKTISVQRRKSSPMCCVAPGHTGQGMSVTHSSWFIRTNYTLNRVS